MPNKIKLLLLNKKWFVISIGIILSFIISYQIKSALDKQVNLKNEASLIKSSVYLQEKVDLYVHGLQGMGGIYLSKNFEPDYNTIRTYAQFRNFYDNFPGALGFGFIRKVNKSELTSYVSKRKQKIPDFSVRHLSKDDITVNDDYHIIEAIEPIENNKQARGLNTASEYHRRNAAVMSMTLGRPIITHQIQLVQSQKKEPGFLIFLPIYKNGELPGTLKERKEQLVGWTYTPITLNSLLKSLKFIESHIDLKITDITDGAPDLLYVDDNFKDKKSPILNIENFESTINISGRRWKIESKYNDTSAYYINLLTSSVIFIFLSLGVTYIILSIQKLYEQKNQVQMRIKQVESWQSAILNGSNFMIISTNTDGVISTFNNTACKLLGYSEPEVINKHTPALIHDSTEIMDYTIALNKELGTNFEPGFETFVAKAKVNGFDTHEWTYIRKNGTRFPVRLTVTPICDEQNKNTIIGYLGIAEDISEIKKLSQTLEDQKAKIISSSKMSLLGEMAAGIAHEINNPLAIISGKTNQIRRRLMTKEANHADDDFLKIQNDLEKIEQTTIRISKIIKGLKSFSRNCENDPMEYVKLSSIIDDTLELCHQRFINHGIELRVLNSVETKIQCRSTQISQVIMNLLSNAFDAVETLDTKWVEIKTKQNDEFVEIVVTDSGSGIPEAIQNKMLQPFYTTKEVGKGTGLGLSISKGIIEDHFGKLYYDKKGKNTSFVVVIPIRQIDIKSISLAS